MPKKYELSPCGMSIRRISDKAEVLTLCPKTPMPFVCDIMNALEIVSGQARLEAIQAMTAACSEEMPALPGGDRVIVGGGDKLRIEVAE